MKGVSAVALFCEDVRREASGKQTLIGVFADLVRITEMPGEIRRLSVYYRIRFDPSGDYPDPITPHLEWDGQSVEPPTPHEPFRIDRMQSAMADARERKVPFVSISGRIQLREPVQVQNPGQILAFLNVGTEKMLCGSLAIIQRLTPATASTQLPSQSQPDASPS